MANGPWDVKSIRMDVPMKLINSMANVMAKENFILQMDVALKANGKRISVFTGKKTLRMAIHIRVNI